MSHRANRARAKLQVRKETLTFWDCASPAQASWTGKVIGRLKHKVKRKRRDAGRYHFLGIQSHSKEGWSFVLEKGPRARLLRVGWLETRRQMNGKWARREIINAKARRRQTTDIGQRSFFTRAEI